MTRGPHWSDDRRANVGKRARTEPLGVDTSAAPVEVDPEITNSQSPPPPPSLEEWQDLNEQARLLALRDGQEQLAEAMAKVYGGRHDGARLDRMESRLDRCIPMLERAYATLDHWVPQLQSVMSQMARMWDEHTRSSIQLSTFLNTEWPRTVKTIEGVAKALEDVIGRLSRVEGGQLEMTRNHGTMSAQIGGLQAIASSHDVRITALELANRDEQNVAKGGQLVVAKTMRWASAIKGVIATAIAAGAYLIGKFL